MKTVTVYTSPSCVHCAHVKEYLAAQKIAYTEHNIAEDTDRAAEAMALTQKLGGFGVPVVRVQEDDQDDIILGFDEAKLAAALGVQSLDPKDVGMCETCG